MQYLQGRLQSKQFKERELLMTNDRFMTPTLWLCRTLRMLKKIYKKSVTIVPKNVNQSEMMLKPFCKMQWFIGRLLMIMQKTNKTQPVEVSGGVFMSRYPLSIYCQCCFLCSGSFRSSTSIKRVPWLHCCRSVFLLCFVPLSLKSHWVLRPQFHM